MKPFHIESGIAAPLPQPNIDTDVIMPKQFLKRIDRKGLAEGTFHDLRFDRIGIAQPDFVLNQSPYENARFLVCGANFGCGSSREYAVWGLQQIGIRAIIAPSFAGIFYGNCEKNGLLAITLPKQDIDDLLSQVSHAGTAELSIDLPAQRISLASGAFLTFEINPSRKQLLLEGADHVEQTLAYAEDIRKFELGQRKEAGYLWDRPSISRTRT